MTFYKKLSKKLLPGNTPLSISKTVETLVMEKVSKMDAGYKKSMTKEEALEILDNITLESSAYKEIFEYVYGMALALN